VGAGVTTPRPGDLVINLQRENWAQRRRVAAADAIPIPAGLDLKQAAMLRINPATAQLLLEDHVALNPGDWVVQNVANSAVGRHLIVLAKARGWRTINVVRREDVAPELRALGADIVLTDGADLAERARRAAGGPVARRRPEGANRGHLSDRGDQGGIGACPARRARRQGAGVAERAGLTPAIPVPDSADGHRFSNRPKPLPALADRL